MLPNHLQIEYLPPGDLVFPDRQLRTSRKNQTEKTIRLIRELGFMMPVVIDADSAIVIGDHYVRAAVEMKLDTIPVIRADHLTSLQIRQLRIAHDRIAEDADWNPKEMALEFQELQILMPDLDLTIAGFEIEEIELFLDLNPTDPEDDIPEPQADGPAITQLGDLWQMGDHRLYCGDALEVDSYTALMLGEAAQMVFIDAPYNVKIDGHVGNSGKTQHREFAQASGEMSEPEFTDFLSRSHTAIAAHLQDGGIVFSCMDWRHMSEMLAAARAAKLDMINLCVWAKDNGGMGSLYRSQHELVFVFKKGTARHVNNVALGKNGRYRTNLWQYPGVNSFGGGRMDELAMHPTVKPTAMVADAIKDCSKRGDIILDPFGGSGTTLIAADQTARKARLIELDPLYCDVTIRRWQALTGLDATHADTGKTFNEIAELKGTDNE